MAAHAIGDHKIAANGVGVDGTIQMASAIEVVGQTEGVAAAEIALKGQVCLLRIRVDEVLGLRISEGLEGQREGSTG